MENNKHSESYTSNNLCASCIHHSINNGEDYRGCRALPDNIPDIAMSGNNHHKVLQGQVSDYVYQKAKYEELSPLGKILWDLRNGYVIS